MNKGSLVGLALIAIGVLALVLNFSNQQPVFNFFSFGNNLASINDSKEVAGEKINSIDINSTSTGVYVYPSTRDTIQIELTGDVSSKLKDSFILEVNERKDKLEINVKRKSEVVVNIFGAVTVNTRLEVHVPEKYYETMKITTSSGKITIEDLEAKTIDLRASSGSLNVFNISAEKGLDIQTSSGRIHVKDSKASRVSARASSGSVSFDSLKGEKINVATSSGSIQLRDSEGEISVAASSGSVIINNKQLTGDINVATSSGRVEMSFKETPSAIIDFKGSSGRGNVTIPGISFEQNSNNNIYGKVGTGDYHITVRTSSGGFALK